MNYSPRMKNPLRMRNNTKKLDQLTSMRFFAALMIVIQHSVVLGLFGISNFGLPLAQGVSFFFVLSGFILTYVYPKLETWLEIKQFWRARVARIWPAYLASFLLGFWLLHYQWDNKIAAANLLMVQAWMPKSAYYFSYNAVAWSVSAEFFFYLAFPVILYKWNKNWLFKLLFSGAILISLIVLTNRLLLPAYNPPDGPGALLVDQAGVLYISPLSRIFEFIFGMCVALAYRRGGRVKWSTFTATSYELAVIILCVISMYEIKFIAAWIGQSVLGASAAHWVRHSGSMFVFGLLIYIMAHGRGKISEALAHSFLVVLGEISFSLYLIHQILLVYYNINISEFPRLSDPLAFSVFISVLLLSSYLMWTVIEMPGRRLIIGHQKIHGTAVMTKSWQDHLALSWKPILAGLVLCCVIGFIYITMKKPNFISQKEAVNITPASLKGYAGASFGNLFTLRGLDIKCDAGGLNIKLAWESKVTQKLYRTIAIHLINDAGEILGQADYKQSFKKQDVEQGGIWLDTLLIPADKLNGNMKKLAIGIYDASNTLLLIDRNNTDWGGHRLIIPVDKCLGKS